jgi:hypothetical protein
MYNPSHWVTIVRVNVIETIFQDLFISLYHDVLKLQLFDNGLIFNSVRRALTRGVTKFFIRAPIGYWLTAFWVSTEFHILA